MGEIACQSFCRRVTCIIALGCSTLDPNRLSLSVTKRARAEVRIEPRLAASTARGRSRQRPSWARLDRIAIAASADAQ